MFVTGKLCVWRCLKRSLWSLTWWRRQIELQLMITVRGDSSIRCLLTTSWNVSLFCPQHKDIQSSVTEDRKQEILTSKKLESDNLDIFFPQNWLKPINRLLMLLLKDQAGEEQFTQNHLLNPCWWKVRWIFKVHQTFLELQSKTLLQLKQLKKLRSCFKT